MERRPILVIENAVYLKKTDNERKTFLQFYRPWHSFLLVSEAIL